MKYRGKTSVTPEQFNQRNDKYLFEKLAKSYPDVDSAIGVCVANFMETGEGWIYEDLQNANEVYLQYVKIKSSLKYHLGNNLAAMKAMVGHEVPTWRSFFHKTPSGNKAPALQLFLSKKILPDTLCFIFKSKPEFLLTLQQENSNDPMITNLLKKIIKYTPFSR